MAETEVTRAADLLERIYATGKVEADDGSTLSPFPSGLPREHADEIMRLVREHHLMRTIETGLAYGISALAIGSVHQERGEGTHIAIDPGQNTHFKGIGRLNVERAGLADRVTVLAERADAALPRLRAEGVRLDFALIDGKHIFDFVLLDFFYIDRMLEIGGLVTFHDTWKPAVAEVVSYVSTNRAYEELDPIDHGLTVLRKLDDDTRKGWFHRDFERGARRGTLRYELTSLPGRIRRRAQAARHRA
ncbi:MAG TPA: class I SAM-dependent methyltransferase [Thermoleophilaceae bacterium]|jgi:predicted O-methyltransferase YrrM|nr:class I SAM-dependent methyltransferase [Thermoleophilaceae bacterium]